MEAKRREQCLQQAFLAPQLPLLTDALDALVDLLRSQGAAPDRYLGAKRGSDWLKKASSFRALCDSGRIQPELLDRALAEIADDALGAAQIIDRFLLPYALLAAARPQLSGDPPPWLVDALAAMIAVDAEEVLLDVAVAQDRLDGESGCLTLPWLARRTLVARWLARQLTPARLWRVLAGKDDWRAVLSPELLAQAQAIHAGAAPQVVSGSYEEDDVFSLMDAFHALTCARQRQRGLPASLAIVPAGGGLLWQLANGQLRAAGESLSVTQSLAAGFLEPPLHALPIPVALGAGLRTAGWHTLRLELDDVDAADELLDALLDLALDPLAPQTLDGLGFRIVPLANP